MNAIPSTPALELPNIAIGLLVVLFIFISVVMILIVLIQRPQGGGLSGAFGSATEGAGQTAFGAKTGDVLTTATIIIFLVFLSTAVVLNYAVRPSDGTSAATVSSTEPEPGQEGGGALPEGQQIIPVTPTPDGMVPATGTVAPDPVFTTDSEGNRIEMTPVTDPRMLEALQRGQDPSQVVGQDDPSGETASEDEPSGEGEDEAPAAPSGEPGGGAS